MKSSPADHDERRCLVCGGTTGRIASNGKCTECIKEAVSRKGERHRQPLADVDRVMEAIFPVKEFPGDPGELSLEDRLFLTEMKIRW